MALIIHELSTDQAEQYGAPKTIRLFGAERQHMVTMAATIETSEDLPTLCQFVDAFISKHTTLLPDYRGIKFPCARLLSLVISTGKCVSITFYDVDSGERGTNYQYQIPTKAQLAMPPPERDRIPLERLN